MDDQPFLRDGVDVAVDLNVVAVLDAAVCLVYVEDARLAADLRAQDISVARGRQLKLELLCGAAVPSPLNDVGVVGVRAAGHIEIFAASRVFEGISYSGNKPRRQRIAVSDGKAGLLGGRRVFHRAQHVVIRIRRALAAVADPISVVSSVCFSGIQIPGLRLTEIKRNIGCFECARSDSGKRGRLVGVGD